MNATLDHTTVDASPAYATSAVVFIGKESVGKTQLLATLTGRHGGESNFRGSTVQCDEYAWHDLRLIDTPGMVRDSDAATTRLALTRLTGEDRVVLVVQATHLDDDLADLLPLVEGRRLTIVVSYWDKVADTPAARAAITQLQQAVGVPVLCVDARMLSAEQRTELAQSLTSAAVPRSTSLAWRSGWRIEPQPGLLEHRYLGPPLAALLLVVPAVLAVQTANSVAGWCDPLVRAWLQAWVDRISAWPSGVAAIQDILVGDYGLLTMGPLLLVWAVPTVLLFAVLLGAYKASGLVDRINAALHPWVRPLGIAGRDVTRVVMGFGCNVPAVISTRACSSCSRGACISAIAFGSACSYQLPATLAVFAAVGAPWLAWPFLSYLLITTVIYLRLTSSSVARSSLNRLLVERRSFLQWPSATGLWRELRNTMQQFLLQAMPTFLLIAAVASLLHTWGVLASITRAAAPLMTLLNLPGEAALPVVMASIRKDGIMLFAAGADSTTPLALTPAQVLTGTYLAGVLLPCLVTVLTIAREQSWRFALLLVTRQLLAALGFSLVLAWGARWLLS